MTGVMLPQDASHIIADRYDKILRPRFIKRNRERTGQDPSFF
jgi:hypothetical protein